MIILPRCRLRALRAVLRRPRLGLPRRGPAPPLALVADPDAGLRVRFQCPPLAVEASIPGTFPEETLLVPLEALAEAEGRDDTPVTFERAGPGRTLVRWQDRGIPRAREHAVPDAGALAPFPAAPETLQAAPADLLDALAEATRVAGDESPRHDLRNLQLRGDEGEVVATDGRQLLVRRVGRLPWADDLLVRGLPLLAAGVLPRDRPVELGRVGGDLALRAGGGRSGLGSSPTPASRGSTA